MQYRQLGGTGEKVSMIGMGGIVVSGLSQAEADAAVAEAIDSGVNYIDVAPTYGDAEERLGGALVGKRDHVFLACKTTQRTRAEAEDELNRTLSRLRTDHADVYQMHGLDKPEELATALGPGGALEAFEAARAAGKIRFIGITGHFVDNLCAAVDTGNFDTVLFPVSFAQFEMAGSGPELMRLAADRGIGRLAIKAAAKGHWAEGEEHIYPKCWYKPISRKDLFELSIRYALSQDISAALPPGDLGLFRMALDVAKRFEPIDAEGVAALRDAAGEFTPLFEPRKGS
ncbi:MAG: aldo/keto reductase [Armatimonadota bacterium]|nr:aldo/keto reductase [Armatimonadota bacterium]